MRLAGSVVELVGSLVIVAWGAAAWAGRPWWWRWWARRPSAGEGRAATLVGVGAAVWSVGEGIELVPGTMVQLAGLAVVVAGGAALAVACARVERTNGEGPDGGP